MKIPVVGVWKREVEEDPIGQVCDDTTLVLWTQAPCGMYVDLRLPQDSPGRSSCVPNNPAALAANGCSESVKNLLANQIDVILRQKSFAGYLDYKAGDTTSGDALQKDATLKKFASSTDDSAIQLCTCFWSRSIDYHPPTGGLDVGVCASEAANLDGSVLLRETGQDADYAEDWSRLQNTNCGPSMALELESENDLARNGYWVRVGDRFAYAVGYPGDEASAKALSCPESASQIPKTVRKDLSEAVSSYKNGEVLEICGSYVAVFGEISGDNQWNVVYSTHPELVGCRLIGEANACSTVVCIEGNLLQTIPTAKGSVKRQWKVVELTGCSLPS